MNTRTPPGFDPTRVPHLLGSFAPVTEEVDVADLEVTGELPASLDGLYVRNGPNPVSRRSARTCTPSTATACCTGSGFPGSRPLPQPLRTHPRGAGRGARRTRPLGRPRIDDRAGRRPGRTGARRNLQGPARHQCGPARRPHAGPRRIGLPVPDRCGPGDPRPRGVRRIPAGGHHRPSQDRPGHRRDGRLLLRTGAALPDLVGHRPGRRRHARADHRRRGGRADDDPRHGPDRPLRRPRPHPGLLRPGRGHGGRLVPGLAARARHPRGTDPARRRSASLGDGRGVLAVAHRERLRRRPRRGRPGDPRLRAVEQADRR